MPKNEKHIERRYKTTALHLEKAIQDFVARQRIPLRQALASIAQRVGVSIDAVNSWRRGVRRIPEGKIEALVKALSNRPRSKVLTPEGVELAGLLNASRDEKPELILSWRESIEHSDFKLRVRQARYEGAGRFWERVFCPFLDAACVNYIDPSPGQTTNDFHELQAKVWSGGLDVALGILSTPRLSLKLWFFNSPIHWRLNCVGLADEVERLGGARRVQRLVALAPRAKRAASSSLFRNSDEIRRSGHFDFQDPENILVPIVMRGEIGEAYTSRNLGFNHPISLDALNAGQFHETLLNNATRIDGRVALIVVDEITCLSVLTKLKGRGRLIFPLLPDHRDRRTPIPPSFPLGLCVSRNERVGHAKKNELMSFIRDGLSTYIEGNARSIAFSYLTLRDQIRHLVDQALPDRPDAEREEWVVRAFRMNVEAINLAPPHWRAVLTEAMAIDARKN